MTDLDRLFAAALTDEPEDRLDVAAVVTQGRVRRTRRRRLIVGGVAVATAASVVAAVAVTRAGPGDGEPAPADPPIVRVPVLEPGDALVPEDPLLQHHDPARGDGVRDSYDGITDDGLVVRQRALTGSGHVSFGLVDPTTGETSWLPDPPQGIYRPQPLVLETDRLVFFVQDSPRYHLLTFDRPAGAWSMDQIAAPPKVLDPHGPFTVVVGDRLFLLQSAHHGDPECESRAESGEIPWDSCFVWSSVALADAADHRPEPAAAGVSVGSYSGQLAVVRDRQEVVWHDGETERVLPLGLPDGCEPAADWVPRVSEAGDALVVLVDCIGLESAAVLYDQGLEPVAAVVAAGEVGAHGDFLTIRKDVTSGPGPDLMQVVDPDGDWVYPLAGGAAPSVTDIGAGLVLWQDPSSTEVARSGHSYWVGRLPAG